MAEDHQAIIIVCNTTLEGSMASCHVSISHWFLKKFPLYSLSRDHQGPYLSLEYLLLSVLGHICLSHSLGWIALKTSMWTKCGCILWQFTSLTSWTTWSDSLEAVQIPCLCFSTSEKTSPLSGMRLSGLKCKGKQYFFSLRHCSFAQLLLKAAFLKP